MKDNIIALPMGRIRRDTAVNLRKKGLDPDTMVNLVESDPGHIARREARRNAYYAAIAQEREDNNRLLMNVSTVGMFSMLAALIGWGLWL